MLSPGIREEAFWKNSGLLRQITPAAAPDASPSPRLGLDSAETRRRTSPLAGRGRVEASRATFG